MPETMIEIEGLCQSYGRKLAVDHLTLRIPRGMFGLLGPNGAGKTTLMRTIAALMRCQQGRVTVCGAPVQKPSAVRPHIGYLPQDFALYPNMTVEGVLRYLGLLSGLSAACCRERIPALLEQVNLKEQARKRVRALSGGMLRRLGIAQALLHDPEVLILDEPTAGLDPEERVRLRALLGELAEQKTVLLSTHVVGDIEASCEEIAVMDGGRLIYCGAVEALRQRAQGKVYETALAHGALAAFRAHHQVTSVTGSGKNCLVRFLAPQEDPCIGRPCEPSVEDAYLLCVHAAGGEAR